MINFDLIPTKAYWIVIGVLTLAVGAQQVRISSLKADVAAGGTALAHEQSARSAETAERAELARAHTVKIAELQSQHAAQQQRKDNDYAAKIQTLEAGKRADAVLNGRLRDRIAAYAASDRRPGETDAAAVERYANRLGIVSGLLAESVDLVVESRAVVGQRDLEVGRLLQQIEIDRAACTAPAGASGAPKP